MGYDSLLNNENAGITAVGYTSLTANTTGDGNSAFGYQALKSNTTGSQNSSFGQDSLMNNVGDSNSSFGWRSMATNTIGDNNTAFGVSSLRGVNTGDNNTAIGYTAGDNISSGNSNIIIGSGMDALSATNDDQLNIGNWIYGHEGNIGIGTTLSTHKLRVAGDISASSYYGDGSNLTGVSGGGGGLSVANSANNRIITSVDSSNGNAEASLTFDGSSLIVTGSTTLYRSGSVGDTDVLTIEGAHGNLFSITDELSGSLFSVNDISGLPVLEVFSDNTIKMGTFGAEAIFVNNAVSGSSVGIGHIPTYRFDVSGSARITDTLTVQSDISASTYYGDGSNLTGISAGGSVPAGTVSSSAQTIAHLTQSIYTIDFMDAWSTVFYAPKNLQIDSINNIVDTPSTTILQTGSAYTFGNRITIGQAITVSVTGSSVIQLITTI
jgi:hypothetical protein